MAPQRAGLASGLALVGAVVTTVANFAMAWLVSTQGAAAAGVFFVATAIATIAGNASSLGAMTGVVYAMPQAESAGGARRVLGMAVRPVLAVGVATTLLLALGASWLARLVSDGDAVADLASMLRVMALAVVPFALNLIFAAITRALGSQTPTVVTTQVIRPGGQILLLGATFALSEDPSPTVIAAAWTVPVVAAAVVAVVWAVGFGAFERRAITDPAALTSAAFWEYTRPRALSTALQIALERIDVVLVSAFVGGGPAGVYGALSRFVTAGSFLIYSVAQAVSPTLRGAIAGHRWPEARRLLQQATVWLVLVVWPYFALLAVKPGPLAGLLSADYVSDAPILAVLALGMMVSAAAGPIELTLLMLGHSRRALVGIVAAMATDLVLLAVLAPPFGLWGAAIAWSASIVVQNAVSTFYVWRETATGGTAGADAPLRAQSPAVGLAAAGAVAATVPIGLLVPDTLQGVVYAGVGAAAILAAWIVVFRRQFGLTTLMSRR